MSNIEWIKLVEFGQYQHPKGLQIVDRSAAEAIIEYFSSLRGKFMRKFLGLPIYVGHPDDPEYDESHNKTVYGRIENMKIEDNALWILSHWTEVGRKIFYNGFLKYLSPRWMMKKLNDEVFLPIRLLSVGLTNHPNLRSKYITKAMENSVNDEGGKCAEQSDNQEIANKIFNEVEQNNLSNGGNISLENIVEFQDVSQEAEDANFYENLHTYSLTNNLVERKFELSFKDKILKLVYEQMTNSGDDYQSAWMTVKRQNPGLFK